MRVMPVPGSTPAIPGNQRAPMQLFLTNNGDGLKMAMPIKRGARKWMISALNTKECLAMFNGQPTAPGTSLPNRYQIKYGHFPLDTVNDYILRWQQGEQDSYPRLFVTRAQLPDLRKSIPNPERFTARVAAYRKGEFGQYALDGQITPTSVYFVTGDEEVGRNIAESSVKLMQLGVDLYLNQQEQPLGVAPHVQYQIASYLAMADAGLASDKLSPELRQRILAQLAFLGYVFDSPQFWSTRARIQRQSEYDDRGIQLQADGGLSHPLAP